MKRLRLLIDFTYDDEMMHGGDGDPVAREWFMQLLLTRELILHENDEIGDDLGEVRVVEILPDGRGGSHDYDGLTWCPKIS
ncbi:MAG: hypothetical protein KGR26_11830 [Cyanobacteria bacterium REEB65]|nr:hypothetical protein [Cyanobacteria bacterium REEB65]